MGFAVLVAVASVIAGATAAVAGFGIGSLLTPVFTAFVATATAAALAVDLARLPVYAAAEGTRVWAEWPMVALATAGAIAGTLAGGRLLDRLPEARFRLVVAAVLILLGLVMLVRSVAG
jgi:uncharacterized membrane protein YfcA